QFVSELTDRGWDIGGSGHALSYGINSRKINGGNAASLQVAPFFDLHPEQMSKHSIREFRSDCVS
ncbi:MAG TPA: hypothetical protein VG456_28740, partial [Candidatus Sulfopaludibacter sp.]|nr:hypothetical protein [Candidatus Sulfopaludibacter sp.]